MFTASGGVFWVVLVLMLASTPGHFLRYHRYQTSCDLYLGAASILVCLACGVSLLHERPSACLDEFWWLGLEVAVWVLAACAVLAGFLVVAVTHREEFLQRVRGLTALEKAQFWLGSASLGNPPAIGPLPDDQGVDRHRASAPALFFGVFLLVTGVLSLVLGGVELGSWATVGGLVLVVGCGIDSFVRHARKREKQEAIKRRARARVRCRNCGYSLKGLEAPRCPECGEPFPRD